MNKLDIVVLVPPPPYEGECLPPAPPVDWSTTSSLVIRRDFPQFLAPGRPASLITFP